MGKTYAYNLGRLFANYVTKCLSHILPVWPLNKEVLVNIYQLLDEPEQNIMICQWRATSYLPMPKAEANNW